MKQFVRILGLVLVLSLVLSVTTWAQSQDTSGRGGRGRGRFYDLSAVTTVSGAVVSVETTSGRQGGPGFIRLSLALSKETVNVMVGPANYLEEQKMTIKAKDSIKVKGAKMERNGNVMIAAGEITIGKKTYTLRDENGTPKWGGQGQGRRGNNQ